MHSGQNAAAYKDNNACFDQARHQFLGSMQVSAGQEWLEQLDVNHWADGVPAGDSALSKQAIAPAKGATSDLKELEIPLATISGLPMFSLVDVSLGVGEVRILNIHAGWSSYQLHVARMGLLDSQQSAQSGTS